MNGSNPSVKDRINACNAQILNSNGVRSFKVNVEMCPNLVEALEQQAYDKHGAPDKTTGHDHVADGFGYALVKLFPIRRPISSKTSLSMRN